jgi:hypothetical protein
VCCAVFQAADRAQLCPFCCSLIRYKSIFDLPGAKKAAGPGAAEAQAKVDEAETIRLHAQSAREEIAVA